MIVLLGVRRIRCKGDYLYFGSCIYGNMVIYFVLNIYGFVFFFRIYIKGDKIELRLKVNIFYVLLGIFVWLY